MRCARRKDRKSLTDLAEECGAAGTGMCISRPLCGARGWGAGQSPGAAVLQRERGVCKLNTDELQRDKERAQVCVRRAHLRDGTQGRRGLLVQRSPK